MEDKMTYVFGDYLVEFVKNEEQINGKVFYPGEESPVGGVTCHYYCHNNPNDVSHEKDDSIHIDVLRVHVAHQQKGIGTYLMKRVMEYAEKSKIKHVTTTPAPTSRMSIEELKKFYLHFRFGSTFIGKKIEFVDEEGLIADVIGKKKVDSSRMTNQVLENTGGRRGPLLFERGTKANRVGYLTIVHYMDKELPVKSDVLQIGIAGADVFGTYLSKKGFHVTLLEPDSKEVEYIRKKNDSDNPIEICNKPYTALNEFPDDSMGAVLCFGPMYTAVSMDEKAQILKECYRICKSGGKIFVSFMSNEMMVMENTFNSNPDFICGPRLDKITMKAICPNKRLFKFDEIEALFSLCNIKYSKCFAAEGVCMLVRDKMERLNEKQFNAWMEYHYHVCENKEMIGCTNHIVYIIKK